MLRDSVHSATHTLFIVLLSVAFRRCGMLLLSLLLRLLMMLMIAMMMMLMMPACAIVTSVKVLRTGHLELVSANKMTMPVVMMLMMLMMRRRPVAHRRRLMRV